MSRPWARPCAAALFWACALASLPLLISPASPRRCLLGLDIQHLDLDRRDDLRSAPDQDAADGDEPERPGAERGRAVQRGDHDREKHDLDQVGDQRGHHHGLRALPRGPADHQHADAEEHGDDGHPDERADQSLDAHQGGTDGNHDRGGDGRQRSRAPHDRGVLRQHYEAPEGWTAILLTREDVPHAMQEPVAEPLPRSGYPVRFTKGITGLSLAVEGLLVKAITKSLTLSLPDRAQFMTNPGRRARETRL